METPELKPCPFCGSETVIIDQDGRDDPLCWALCDECGSCGAIERGISDAAKAWNARAEVKAEKGATDEA